MELKPLNYQNRDTDLGNLLPYILVDHEKCLHGVYRYIYI